MTGNSSGRFLSGRAFLTGLVVALPLFASVAPLPAVAQDQSLVNQVQRLQRELLDLQRTVYQGGAATTNNGGASGGASANGGSVGGDVNTTQAARIELRLQQFQREQQNLTGRVEDLGFAVDELSQRLELLVTDVDRRLQALESGGGGVGPLVLEGNESGSSEGSGTAGGAFSAGAEDSGTPTTLGSISQDNLDNFQASQQGETTATVALTGSDRDQYDQAFALLRQANYPEAEAALRTFIADNPSSPLVGNAKYWLGETYYARGDYQQAAVTFAEAFQEYPDGAKAPDNLLKLGMSLGSLQSVEDACGTFTELMSRYPNAAASIQRRVQIERQKYNCP